MTAANPERDRLSELLADRAVQGLSAHEAAELDRLLAALPGAEAESDAMELAAAAAHLAMLAERPADPLPAALRNRLVSTARGARRGYEGPAVVGTLRPPGSGPAGWLGWLAAAACLALAAMAWFGRAPTVTPPPIDPSAERAALLTTAPDIKQWPWATAGELEGKPVLGDVVWSTARQAGYMSFAGLPVNDPTKEQYQLWIFDPAQSDKTPIDGGVFDVAVSGVPVVVPIDPKIRVSDAVLFAVTVEKPGGVVVSDRSRLILLAKPG